MAQRYWQWNDLKGDRAVLQPKFLVGDPVTAAGMQGIVRMVTSDGKVCITFEDGSRRWVDESEITWCAGFVPLHRPKR